MSFKCLNKLKPIVTSLSQLAFIRWIVKFSPSSTHIPTHTHTQPFPLNIKFKQRVPRKRLKPNGLTSCSKSVAHYVPLISQLNKYRKCNTPWFFVGCWPCCLWVWVSALSPDVFCEKVTVFPDNLALFFCIYSHIHVENVSGVTFVSKCDIKCVSQDQGERWVDVLCRWSSSNCCSCDDDSITIWSDRSRENTRANAVLL